MVFQVTGHCRTGWCAEVDSGFGVRKCRFLTRFKARSAPYLLSQLPVAAVADDCTQGPYDNRDVFLHSSGAGTAVKVLAGLLGRVCPLLLLWSGRCWHSLACGPIARHSDLCLPGHIAFPSECLRSPSAPVRTFVTGFRAHWVVQDDHISRSFTVSAKILFPNQVAVSASKDLM